MDHAGASACAGPRVDSVVQPGESGGIIEARPVAGARIDIQLPAILPGGRRSEEPMIRHLARRTLSLFSEFAGDCRGSVTILTAVAMPILVGFAALGVEVGFWYHRQKAIQDAADSAAVAAATTVATNAVTEARAVAAKYGFVHDGGNVVIRPEESEDCPPPPAGVRYSGCYRVTIETKVPLLLLGAVGYGGNTTVTEGAKQVPGVNIAATGVASRASSPRRYCIVALGNHTSAGFQDLRISGAPDAKLNNCGIISNETMQCNGNATQAQRFAEYADSPYGDPGPHPCGRDTANGHTSRAPQMEDPYSYLGDSIYNRSQVPCDAQRTVQDGGVSYSVSRFCGNKTLSANTALPQNTIWIVDNGRLDLNGRSLTGSSAAIIFTGENNGADHYIKTSNGSIDITAPAEGTWKGVALYKDPRLDTNVSYTSNNKWSGNDSMFFNGLVYMPNSDLEVSGSINHNRTSTTTCLAIVVKTFLLSGNGSFLANGDGCNGTLDLPSFSRGRLVL